MSGSRDVVCRRSAANGWRDGGKRENARPGNRGGYPRYHPWLQGFSTADAVFEEICGLAGEVGVPIVLHDGTPPYSLPEQVAGLARRFSRTTFLLGHSGLLWSWRSAVEAARQPNVWLCLCGPHLRGLEILCEKVDPSRIVWGSDYGFGFADQIEYRLDLLRHARIGDGLKERILRTNPLCLLSRPGCAYDRVDQVSE